MSLFGSKKVSSYTLTISLKSSSVDVQLISIPGNQKKEVVLARRKIILLTDSQDPQTYTKQCLNELSTLLKSSAREIHELSGGSISRTNVVLYAPWFTSHITPIKHKESVQVSEKFLLQQLKTIKTPEKLINLEKKVIKILANGYAVSELNKNKLNNISLDVYSSYISDSIYKTLNDTIKSSIPIATHRIDYTSSPVLMLGQIKSLLVREDNVTFVYIGGEITEIGVIEDDSLSFYATFPIGKHDFLRNIQTTVKSYDYDLLYHNQVQIKSKAKQEQFEKLKDQWGNLVLSTLLSFKQNVPSKLLIISDSKTKDFFVDTLMLKIKTAPQTSFGQYRIINFDISHLKDIIIYKTPTGADELDLQLEALI